MYKIITFICLSLGSVNLLAQDLLDIYQLALQQDAELKIAEADYQAARESLPVAVSARRPQVDLTTQGSLQETDRSSTGSNSGNSFGFSLNLAQSLYNAQSLAYIDAAEARVAKAQANLIVSQQDLIVRVAGRYFDILAAQDEVDFAQAEQNSIARQLEQAQKRFEVGLIAITDVKEAQARYDTALAQALLAKNLLDNAVQALQVIIAQAPGNALARLGDNLDLDIPEPANSQQWVDMSLNNNQSLVAVLAEMRASGFDRQRLSKADYPTVDLIASYSDTTVSNNNLADFDETELSLLVQLRMPLFTGGRSTAERAQSEANYQSALNTALLQKRLTSQQTRIAYLGVVSGIGQVKALKQALESSTTALEATEAGFEVGTRTSVDVLISLRETYRARRDYASARYNYLLNTLKLKQAAGLLSADDLKLVNRWLTR